MDPVVTSTTLAGTPLVNNKGGDSLFGKVMKFVKKEGEMVLASIETEVGKVEVWLHISQVKPVTAIPISTPPAVPTTDQI